jgi:hypothetical protein
VELRGSAAACYSAWLGFDLCPDTLGPSSERRRAEQIVVDIDDWDFC